MHFIVCTIGVQGYKQYVIINKIVIMANLLLPVKLDIIKQTVGLMIPRFTAPQVIFSVFPAS